ncbi:MAG TPA: hypothetical protein VFN96_05235 [Gemmatimonadales bacterium]|nr:hypothetical protein [Gemmatimonadales bacterium]
MPRNLLAAGVAVLLAGPLMAQSTGTPVFHAPYRAFQANEYGLVITDQGNISLEGFWGFSQSNARWDFKLRAGVQDYDVGNAALLVGVDARYRVIDQTEEFPLDGAFITGIGASLVQDFSRLFIPIGLSLGRRVHFQDSNLSLVPYVQPVIVPILGSGDDDVAVAMGLGGDLRINQRFELRLGIGVGDLETFSFGFSITR